MSEEDEWRAALRRANLPEHGHDIYVRCGLGRRGLGCGHHVMDSVPASEWRPLRQEALAANYGKFDAGDLDGRKIGDAFMAHVIGDPKVRACGAWLAFERPTFGELFVKGKYPKVRPRGRASLVDARDRQVQANVGYAATKERLRGLPPGTLSKQSRQATPSRPAPPPGWSIDGWDDKWPVVLEAEKLSEIFSSAYEPHANYRDNPFEGPIHHAAEALADRHKAFFDLLRECVPKVIADGTTAAGLGSPIPGAQWDRADRSLDIRLHDVWCNQFPEHSIWSGITLRRAVSAIQPTGAATKSTGRKPVDSRRHNQPEKPSRTERNTAKQDATEQIKGMMKRSPESKTIELGVLKERWLSGGGSEIPNLSERGLEEAWRDARNELALPPDSPWRKRGPRRGARN